MTIRSKLILLYSGLLAIIIVAFGIVLFAVARWVLQSSVDNTLTATVDQIWRYSHFEEIGDFGGPSELVVWLPANLDFFQGGGVVVQVWQLTDDQPILKRPSPNILGYSDPIDSAALDREQQSFENADAPLTGRYTTVRVSTGEWRVLTRPLDVRGWHIVIQAAISFEAVNQASQGLVVIIIVGTGIALIGSIVLGTWLTGRALKPIEDITRSAAQITAADDLKTRLNWNGPMDELGELVSVFNGAMERLEHLFSVQQRFVADVSHELRTPLTAITGNVELIKRYGMDTESLDAIDSETRRMSRLVNDLLLLARADNGELKLNPEELDLDILVGEAYREARILAKDRDLTIEMADFEPVRINGDADRLKQTLSNLISNAIKFTPDGGRITISLTKTDTAAVIRVKDTGAGIAPEHLQRIFDRFYQADASRVKTGGEGAGLGLSIAHWIVEAHSGSIQVESTVGAGTTFIVTLPHAEEPERTLNQAVTRPRLSIIRRSSPPPDKDREKAKP